MLSVATQTSLTFFVHSPYSDRVVRLGSDAQPRPWSPETHPLVARFQLLSPPVGGQAP